MNYRFEEVEPTQKHIDTLFSLLSKRKYNISHKIMPSYSSHKEFVIFNPYRYWFLITFSKEYIGTFYIQFDNSIGINIVNIEHYNSAIKQVIDFIKFKFSPSPAIKSKVSEKFFINVPADDLLLNDKLNKIGYKPKQISYLIE